MHYDKVENYAMKCRLYPTAKQREAIDDAITAVRVFHNCLVYDMWNNGINLREKPRKGKDGSPTNEVVHFPDIGAALKSSYKDKLKKEHPIIQKCPQGALTTNDGLRADLMKEFGKNPIEYQKPTYYTERHPRRSYSYRESLSKVSCTENKKVFYFNLAMVGMVKVRGWNQKIRFGNENTDFLSWAIDNPREKVAVIISKDSVGDYFLVIKLKECLKPFPEMASAEIGIDVGIKDIAICSDGRKYENIKVKKSEKPHQKRLNRELSRRWGPSNELYRAAKKKELQEKREFTAQQASHEETAKFPSIRPSKRYLRTRLRHARLNRKVERVRSQWNHKISKEIVAKSKIIGVETLSIKNMVRNKHLSYALTDAAFGSLLQDIQYKAIWHGRTVLAIDAWTPSSKRCSVCGYIYGEGDYSLRPWNLGIRNWTCPCCGTQHDRDINAARNILYYATELKQA